MKITLSIPDDLHEALLLKAGDAAKFDAHIVWALTRFGAELSKHERFILLKGKDRQAVEHVFQTTIADVGDLLLKLKHLALFKMGPVERVLDASELAILKDQALFHGRSPEAYLTDVANDIISRTIGHI